MYLLETDEKKQIIRIKNPTLDKGPEILQPPRLKNRETGEGDKNDGSYQGVCNCLIVLGNQKKGDCPKYNGHSSVSARDESSAPSEKPLYTLRGFTSISMGGN